MPELGFSHLAPAMQWVQQGYGWHMHDGGYMGSGFMGAGYWAIGGFLHVIFWVLVLGAIVAVTLVLSRNLGKKDGSDSRSALDRLDERYANGEIDREDYLQRKKDILDR